MSNKTNMMLVDRLRPDNLKKIILLDRVRKQVGDDKLAQNYLFVGEPGSGKSSLARILAKDRASVTLNMSSERGIEVVRTTIKDFCFTKSLNVDVEKDDFKVVFLDELDGAVHSTFDALRATMETFQSSTRFIATCNYIEKIPDAIKSRFVILDYNPKNEEEVQELEGKYLQRLKILLDKVNIEYENDDILLAFIREYFPDFRTIIKQVDCMMQAGVKVMSVDDYKLIDKRLTKLFDITMEEPNPVEIYKKLIKTTTGKHSEFFDMFSSKYIQWILNNHNNKHGQIPQAIQMIADWNFKSNFINDPQLAVISLVYQLQSLMNS